MAEIKNTVNRLIRQYLLGTDLGAISAGPITLTFGGLNLGGQAVTNANTIATSSGVDLTFVLNAATDSFRFDHILGTTTLQIGNTALTLADAVNFVFNATTGTKIGTATTQKLAFYNSAPVVQPTAVADASGGAVQDAEARTALNALLARMRTLGLIAT